MLTIYKLLRKINSGIKKVKVYIIPTKASKYTNLLVQGMDCIFVDIITGNDCQVLKPGHIKTVITLYIFYTLNTLVS